MQLGRRIGGRFSAGCELNVFYATFECMHTRAAHVSVHEYIEQEAYGGDVPSPHPWLTCTRAHRYGRAAETPALRERVGVDGTYRWRLRHVAAVVEVEPFGADSDGDAPWLDGDEAALGARALVYAGDVPSPDPWLTRARARRYARLSSTSIVGEPPRVAQAHALARRARCAAPYSLPDAAAAVPRVLRTMRRRQLRFSAVPAWALVFTHTAVTTLTRADGAVGASAPGQLEFRHDCYAGTLTLEYAGTCRPQTPGSLAQVH